MDCSQVLTHLIFTSIVIEIVWYGSRLTSSDSILPFPNLNTYSGPTLSYVEHGEILGGKYDGISSWNGYGFSDTPSISSISNTGIAASNTPSF
ncbi:hypothetical protein RTP6_006933 [Batrachochytrium dendrobatidis]